MHRRRRRGERLDRTELRDVDDPRSGQFVPGGDVSPVDIVAQGQLRGEDALPDLASLGRLGRAGLTAAEIDTVLGVVLETSDADFNPILERGFAAAIRREWAWRTSRGDSVKNLLAFRHLIEQP